MFRVHRLSIQHSQIQHGTTEHIHHHLQSHRRQDHMRVTERALMLESLNLVLLGERKQADPLGRRLTFQKLSCKELYFLSQP